MPIYDVVIRSRVWIEADTREAAAADASRMMAKAWTNMALGYDAIPRDGRYRRYHAVDRAASKLDARQRVTNEEPNESS